MMCGGLTPAKAADAETQALVDKFKPQVASRVNKQFDVFKALEVATQVVAGTNYFVKVHLGGDECAHLRIFVPLPCNGGEPELHGVEYPKTKDSPLVYIKQN